VREETRFGKIRPTEKMQRYRLQQIIVTLLNKGHFDPGQQKRMQSRVQSNSPETNIDRALFMTEISKWYDWMVTQIASRRLIELDAKTSVLVVANAIRAVDSVVPRYYGSLQRRVPRSHDKGPYSLTVLGKTQGAP
jgi:hypothetical protein